MRRSRAEQKELNRRALIASARHLIATQGTNVPVDAIAEAADLTTGAIYSIFGSKRDLFLAIVEEGIQADVAGIDDLKQSFQQDDPPLRATLETYARRAASHVDDAFHEETRLEALMTLLCLDDDVFREQCLHLQHAQRSAVAALLTGRPVSSRTPLRRVTPTEAEPIATALLALTSGYLLRGVLDDHAHLDGMVRACAALADLVGDDEAPAANG
ncbi:helix-turn-helix domain-containing protein [Streptomyces sp. NPDC048057]|uniref:TetR/AcrR family transcriptional regulator n=1 Tax=Streptomyces sp. NPDC048057 TaxID=3155628 RepID=UPI0033FC82DB